MNAIERVVAMKAPTLKSGDELAKSRDALVKRHRLERMFDPALPRWAAELLSDSEIGASVRIAMVLTHHFDITGEVASERYVCKEVPKTRRPTKIEMERFRDGQKKAADRYIRNRRKSK